MILSVVDTNVLVVANGSNDAVGPACRLNTIRRLGVVRQTQTLLLDLGVEILGEYRKHCSHSGQPGVGDEFFRWAYENQGRLHRVAITPDAAGSFKEFPADPELASFDLTDRKFVAVSAAAASAEPSTPNEILNAVDSDYSNHRDALRRADVRVTELCPEDLKSQ